MLLRRAILRQDVVVGVVRQQPAVVEHVVLFRDRLAEKSVGEAVQQSAGEFARYNSADAENGVEPFVASAESVVAQLDVAVRVVVVQTFEAIDLKAGTCLDYRMKVVAMVAVGVATVDELVVALAALTDRTVQRGRDGFDLRCQSAERYDFERC